MIRITTAFFAQGTNTFLFSSSPARQLGSFPRVLFCLLFPRLKGIPFGWNGETVALESIQYVRSAFPDASLRVRRLAPSCEVCQYRSVEFEYEAFNYILHKHHKDSEVEKYKLIVCWENNFDKSPESLVKIPPVLELKEVLRTGEITLHQNI